MPGSLFYPRPNKPSSRYGHRALILRPPVGGPALVVSFVLGHLIACQGNAREELHDGETSGGEASHERGEGEEEASSGGTGDNGGDRGRSPRLSTRRPPCIDTLRFFEERVWRPTLMTSCIACHSHEGGARETDFILRYSDEADYLEANFGVFAEVASRVLDGKSIILRKPTLDGVDHAGGLQLDPTGPEYAALSEMVGRLDAPPPCVDPPEASSFYDGLLYLDARQTLRKAVFLLAGRLPTADELGIAAQEGMPGVERVLDSVLDEPGFYERLKQMYNDVLLTDAFLTTGEGHLTVDLKRFPNARYYQAPGLSAAESTRLRSEVNFAVSREPLHLIEWVVRNYRPFGEVLTSDVVIVNPYSARAYDISLELFEDSEDRGEWIAYDFTDLPQAGVLTTPAWLNRYPSSPTNRNRHRSQMLRSQFFAMDLTQLAERPLEVSDIEEDNPTLTNPACTVCHDQVDAWAGAFRHWDPTGRYVPDADWYEGMVPTAFGEEELPAQEVQRALPWLVERIARSDRFALSVVRTMYYGITGQKPLTQPTEPDQDEYLENLRAFEAQQAEFVRIAQLFQEQGQDVRGVLTEWVKSPWFRATGMQDRDVGQRGAGRRAIGTARLLSPELLHKKIEAVTGYMWTVNGTAPLLSLDYYRLFYGGTDYLSTAECLTEMNGVMVRVVDRMANEVSHAATREDFALPPSDRILFPFVDLHLDPEDPNHRARIITNIKHLHGRILGENPSISENELVITYELFLSSRNAELGHLQGDAEATLRAWMVVVAYLLGDFRFLYE